MLAKARPCRMFSYYIYKLKIVQDLSMAVTSPPAPPQSRYRSPAPPKGRAKGVDENPSVTYGDSSPFRGANPAPQGAAPLRGSPQCAHWGKGSPDSDTVQEGKDRTHPDHSFPYRHLLSHGDPSVSLTLDSSPKRGAKGVD